MRKRRENVSECIQASKLMLEAFFPVTETVLSHSCQPAGKVTGKVTGQSEQHITWPPHPSPLDVEKRGLARPASQTK